MMYVVHCALQDGCTALHCATVNGHSRIVLLLLQHGANAALRNKVRIYRVLFNVHCADFIFILDIYCTLSLNRTS